MTLNRCSGVQKFKWWPMPLRPPCKQTNVYLLPSCGNLSQITVVYNLTSTDQKKPQV